MRVLVVEDNDGLSEVVHEFLAGVGHEPSVVRTAELALAEIGRRRPDAVLLDLHLPGMSGLEFLRLETVRHLRVPIVAMSGVVSEGQARESLRLGAFDFLPKPVALEHLGQTLRCVEPYAAALLNAARV